MSWELTNLQEVTSKIGDGLHGTPKYDENREYYFIKMVTICCQGSD